MANISDAANWNGMYGTDRDFHDFISVCKEHELKVLLRLDLNCITSLVSVDWNGQVIRDEMTDLYNYWITMGVDGFYFAQCNQYQMGNDTANLQFLDWTQQVCKEVKEDIVIIGEIFDNSQTYYQYYQSGVNRFVNGRFSGDCGIITRSILSYAGDYSGTALSHKICEVQTELEANDVNAMPGSMLSNGKQGRSSDYFHYNESQIKLAGAISLLMSGNSFILYGEELGMGGMPKDINSSRQMIRDVMVPMCWSLKTTNTSMAIWADEDPKQEYKTIFGSYEDQREDSLSIYNYYRQILQARNAFPAIADGKQRCMEQLDYGAVCGIVKSTEKEQCFVLINTHCEEVVIEIPKSEYYYQGLAAGISVDENEIILEDETLTLPPYGIAILK